MHGARARTKAAERQRRWRQRQHPNRHELIAPVPVCDDVIALLVQTGWLASREWQNRKQIGAAIEAMLKDAARHQRRKP